MPLAPVMYYKALIRKICIIHYTIRSQYKFLIYAIESHTLLSNHSSEHQKGIKGRKYIGGNYAESGRLF